MEVLFERLKMRDIYIYNEAIPCLREKGISCVRTLAS